MLNVICVSTAILLPAVVTLVAMTIRTSVFLPPELESFMHGETKLFEEQCVLNLEIFKYIEKY